MHVSPSNPGPLRARILDFAPPPIPPVSLPSGRNLPNCKNRKNYTWLIENPGKWLVWGPYPGSDRIGVHGTAGRWFRKHFPSLRIECRRNGGNLEVRAVAAGTDGPS